jgi:hypothetical protein
LYDDSKNMRKPNGEKRAQTCIFLVHSLKRTGTVSQHTPEKSMMMDETT